MKFRVLKRGEFFYPQELRRKWFIKTWCYIYITGKDSKDYILVSFSDETTAEKIVNLLNDGMNIYSAFNEL